MFKCREAQGSARTALLPTPFFEIVYALLERKIFSMSYLGSFSFYSMSYRTIYYPLSLRGRTEKHLFFSADVAISSLFLFIMRLDFRVLLTAEGSFNDIVTEL